jgi:hypothetical protein
MPKFTLIKHADSQYDAEVRMDFDSEVVDLAQAHFHDFLQASGFELPLPEEEEDVFNPRLTNADFLALEEDHMWDDAFEAKFGIHAGAPVNMDGILGGGGADIIEFPTK